jgi:phage terminase small subunit
MMPRKSPQLHALQGTRSQAKDSTSEDDSKAFTGGRLKMPPEFKQDPKRLSVWKMLFGPLHKRRTLTKADSAAAVLLVEQWILWETVNAEAQARPFSEVTWVDKNDNEHTKTVESAACKMAANLHRTIMQALQQFSATPASREKTRPTKQPVSKDQPPAEGTIAWINEQVAIARAAAPQPVETAAPESVAPTEPETDFDELLRRPI